MGDKVGHQFKSQVIILEIKEVVFWSNDVGAKFKAPL
jgi:hypothetical protein